MVGIVTPDISLVVVFSQRPGLMSTGLISWHQTAAGHASTMANKIFFTWYRSLERMVYLIV